MVVFRWFGKAARRTSSLVALAACTMMPGVATAQHYQQDFSATFPIFEATPGKVTVTLINESGDTITPYSNFDVIGLSDYVGRPQFAGRTGGAFANQEVSAITSQYKVGANTTTVQYGIDPLPAVGGNGVYTPDRVLDDAFITMTEDGIGGILSAAAWDEEYGAGYDAASHTFAFRIDGTANPANDKADGLAWAYLNSASNGATGIVGPGTSEEPNFSGSLGVGFDIWDNGGEGGNSVSLHFNGLTLASRAIDEGTTDPNTGQPWAFNSFETSEIITTIVEITPGDDVNLNPPVLTGGSAYSVWNRGGPASALVQVGAPGTTEGYLRVVAEAGSTSNVVAFDHDGSGASDEYHATFNFRGLTVDGTRADGMSFLLVPVETYGETGATTIDFGPHEEPNLAGAVGVGFDTFNNDADPQDDPEGANPVGNHVSVHFDGGKLSQENFDRTELDLVTADPNVWHTAQIDIAGDLLSVVITDGVDGSQHIAFSENIPGLSTMGAVRPVFAARTGGAFDHYEIDNFLLTGAGGGLRGDFNNDGVLDASDINALTTQSASGANNAAYDLTGDATVNSADVTEWIKANDIFHSWVGDANLDGEFSSGDLVALFVAGTYETPANPAVWSTGDFNGDGLFTTSDLVAALGDGGYEAGPRAAVSAVPEPAGMTLLLSALLLVRRRRK